MSAGSRNIDDLLPNRDGELDLHRRLLASDPTAPPDLAAAYLDYLIAWLAAHNPHVPSDVHADAASEAICSLIKRPESYAPDRQRLIYYLQMASQADLKNFLRREWRHHRHRQSMESVELSADAGKYLGCDDDPSLRLQIDEATHDDNSVAKEVRTGLTDFELSALQLLERGERRTAEFAKALGIEHLSRSEQKSQVKRFKDRMKKRTARVKRRNESP